MAIVIMFMMVVCFGVLLWISSAFEFLVAIMIDMMIVMHLGYASTWYCHSCPLEKLGIFINLFVCCMLFVAFRLKMLA